MLRQLFLWASRNPWLARRLPRYAFVRRAVRRFLPGETLEDALREADRLRERGMTALLTLLGENVETAGEAGEVVHHYLNALDVIRERGLDAELSVKPTQMGLDVGEELCVDGFRKLLARAAERGSRVWIDMEGSAYTDRTLNLFRRLREERSNVGICLQAYLYRTASDLETLLPLGPAIRLVKGAYAEPRDVAYPHKKDVDRNYLKLAGRLLDEAGAGGRVFPAFGTHDGRMIDGVIAAARSRNLNRSAFEFEMLYGIGRERQARLAAAGYRMRVLISYGSAWFPWYMRRLAERPANAWFVVRSLVAR